MKRLTHPRLGEFEADVWEWRARREMAFPCTGYSTDSISIAAADSAEQPSEDQFQALLDLLNTPAIFREEIAQAVFEEYSREIRPQYLSVLSDTRYTYDYSESDLPELQSAEDVWKLITGLYYIWVNEDATIQIEFSVMFDVEHQLKVKISSGNIEQVWME